MLKSKQMEENIPANTNLNKASTVILIANTTNFKVLYEV